VPLLGTNISGNNPVVAKIPAKIVIIRFFVFHCLIGACFSNLQPISFALIYLFAGLP